MSARRDREEVTGTLAVADVETTFLKDGEKPRTLFWGLAVEGEGYRRFETTVALWRYLEKRRDKLIIYHHHDFDVIQALVDGAPLTVSRVRGGRIMLSHGPKPHEWRNSYMLFPTGLKDILESCGFKKIGLDNLEERNRADTEDALKAFRILDAKYLGLWGIAPLCAGFLTAASVAFASAEIDAGPVPEWIRDRDAYRGGRVEAFRVGPCGESDLWDINSSYPFSFLDAPPKDTLYFLHVEVDTDGASPFFHLDEPSRKLLFPIGKFRTAVWGSSYDRYIAPHGGIKSVAIERRISADFRWIRLVAQRLAKAYLVRAQAKERGDSALAYAAKIGLNSVYGRLGMKPEREIASTVVKLPPDPDITYCDLPGNRFLVFKKIPARPRANYLFASYITCNARARLYDAICRSSGVHYVDTDSLYVAKGQGAPQPQGKAMGRWKYEATEDFAVETSKDYTFGKTVKRKGGRVICGCSKDGLEGPHKEDLSKCPNLQTQNFVWTVKQALDKGVVTEQSKERLTTYDKREILPSGATRPIVVGM